MLPRKINKVICLVFLFAIGGCTLSQTNHVSPDATPTLHPSQTKAIETSAATQTATLSPTSTLIPTLRTEGAYIHLLDLLQNNGNCQLPCLWGIFPDSSTLQGAKNILSPLKGIASVDYLSATESGNIDFNYSKDDILISVDLGLTSLPKDDTVEVISLSTQAFRKLGNQGYEYDYGASPYFDVLSKYSLQKILLTYGIPKEISIGIENNVGEPTAPDFMYTWLLYPELGIFVRYKSLAYIGGGKVESCPSKSFMELWLISPNGTDSYRTVLSSSGFEGYFSSPEMHKSTYEAVNMTITEFYRTFTQSPEQCLTTQLSIWPGPK